MTPRREQPRLLAVVGTILVLGMVAFVDARELWGAFGLFPFELPFGDLVALLAGGEAARAGLDVYAPNPFDPGYRPHVYGPGWLVTGWLGLEAGDAVWLGPLLIALFVGVALAVLAPDNRRSLFVTVALLCSPPVMLLMNRVNNDLIIFLLLAAAAALVSVRHRAGVVGGAALWVVAAVLKIYPFVAWPMLLFRAGPRRRSLAISSGALLVALGLFTLGWSEFQHVARIAPRPQHITSVGLPMVRLLWQTLAEFRWEIAAGGVVGAGLTIVALRRHMRALWESVPLAGASGALFVAGAATWLFCFVANTNHVYRMVLLLLPARLWFEAAGCSVQGGSRKRGPAEECADERGGGSCKRPTEDAFSELGRRQLVLWLVVFWIGLPKRWWLELHQATQSGLGVLTFLVGLEQGLLLALGLALAVALCGVCTRMARATLRTSNVEQ